VDDAAPAIYDEARLLPSPPTSEPSAGGVEIALENGRRVRVEAGADPEAVRRLVALLEGAAP
jgi:hypothetical protein